MRRTWTQPAISFSPRQLACGQYTCHRLTLSCMPRPKWLTILPCPSNSQCRWNLCRSILQCNRRRYNRLRHRKSQARISEHDLALSGLLPEYANFGGRYANQSYVSVCVNFNHLIGRCCTIQLCPKSPWVYFLSFAYAYMRSYDGTPAFAHSLRPRRAGKLVYKLDIIRLDAPSGFINGSWRRENGRAMS
jgi:hypothetical protein